MALIVLAAICLLACMFLLFVLYQWTRDTKRRATTRAAVDDAAGGSREKLGYRRLLEHLQRSATLFPKVTPGPEQERAVAFAGPEATGSNGLLTRKSSGR
jgi:hypothetical protein